VTGRRFAAALVAAAALLAVCSGQAHATTTKPWKSCKPRAIDYTGMYRIGNDLFAGKQGRLCTTWNGRTLTVDTNLQAQPGGVVAAPYIRVGGWYGANDPDSPFPVPVTDLPRLTIHINVTGNAPGVWQADTDTYGYSTDSTAVNPAVELVIVTRLYRQMPDYFDRVRVAGHWWSATHWITCPAALHGCHPLIIFYVNHAVDRIAEHLPQFIRWVRRAGWWPKDVRYVGNTCLQDEIWSGGKGLHLAMQTTLAGLPVISQIAGGS
jgi:hypothetical protein